LSSAAQLALVLVLALNAYGQQDSVTPMPADAQAPAPNPRPPRSDSNADSNTDSAAPRPEREAVPSMLPDSAPPMNPNESTSRSTIIDLSPPVGDAQDHPDSEIPAEAGGGSDTTELHPWNPHRADKDIEVGDYYFKEKNYRGAEGRYRDALLYKPNDAIATYRLAQIFDKTERPEEARQYYQAYLKILPHGPYASDCHKALERLQAQSKSSAQSR
jgi:tetratricopeptide (TPR) repeat protein